MNSARGTVIAIHSRPSLSETLAYRSFQFPSDSAAGASFQAADATSAPANWISFLVILQSPLVGLRARPLVASEPG